MSGGDTLTLATREHPGVHCIERGLVGTLLEGGIVCAHASMFYRHDVRHSSDRQYQRAQLEHDSEGPSLGNGVLQPHDGGPGHSVSLQPVAGTLHGNSRTWIGGADAERGPTFQSARKLWSSCMQPVFGCLSTSTYPARRKKLSDVPGRALPSRPEGGRAAVRKGGEVLTLGGRHPGSPSSTPMSPPRAPAE